MSLPRGVRRLFRLGGGRERMESAIDDEMRHHLEMRVDELIDRGFRPEEARRVAEAAFGDRKRYRDECITERRREARMTKGRELVSGLSGDVRYALRAMRKAPAFAAAVIVTLGIGIGANVAIFTVIDALLLEPIPFPEPDELYQVTSTYPEQGFAPVFQRREGALAWKGATDVLPTVELHARTSMVRTDGPEPTTVNVVGITPGTHDLLGAVPVLGRPLNPEDGVPGADGVLLVSEGFWGAELGADPAALGRELILDGRRYRIVGIMPRDFRYPVGGTTSVWTALSDDGTIAGNDPRQVQVVTRIPADEKVVTEERMAAFATGIAELGPLGPNDTNWRPQLYPLNEPSVNSDMRHALWVVFGAVGIMFVIALVNGVNLMLARGTTRAREIGVRLALGGGRTRVAGQLVVESLVLAAVSGVAAVAVAWIGVPALLALAPSELTAFASHEVRVDGRVLLFAGALSAAAGLLFGVLPALRAVRAADATSTAALSAYGSATRARHRLRSTLVVAQVALSLSLLFGAGLLGRSFVRLVAVDPGFEPDGLIALEMTFSEGRYTAAERTALADDIQERLGALPGVVSVARSVGLPPESGITFGDGLHIEGASEPTLPGDQMFPYLEADAGFRSHFGIDLLAGRDFAATDDPADRPVLINEALAQHLGGRDQALGTRFRLGTRSSYWTVVGVVGDVKLFGLDDRWGKEGLIVRSDPSRAHTFVSFSIRSDRDPASLMSEVRAAVHQVAPEQPIHDLAPLSRSLWESVSRPRFFATLMGVFAVLALVLAAAGLYGVLSFAVGQRVREMGIRMALGAGADSVRSLVLSSGLRLGATGAALGVGLSLWGANTLDELLFETSARDGLTLAAVATAMLAVSAVASYLPARRATQVDLVRVLKTE